MRDRDTGAACDVERVCVSPITVVDIGEGVCVFIAGAAALGKHAFAGAGALIASP